MPALAQELEAGARRSAPARLELRRWPLAASAVAFIACLLSAWLAFQGRQWADWTIEARPSVAALLEGHVGAFLRLAPPYGGSLLLRAPFMALARLAGGGAGTVYAAGAVPCLAAGGALGAWLALQLKRGGGGALAQATTAALGAAGPLAIITLQQGHPEEILGGVLCVLAVLCAQRERALWSGILVGLALVNKEWGILAAGPVLATLSRDRGRALAAMGLTAGALLAPFVLVRAGGFVGQTEAVALHSDNIFGPLQLWWFWGTPAHGGARVGPAWLAGIGHTLPVALAVPLSLLYARRRRADPERRRQDALLLLALLLLLRCALDPWDVVYYPVPFLLALLAWEGTRVARPPLIALAASLITWFIFQGVTYPFSQGQDTIAATFAVVAGSTICAIAGRLFGDLRPRRPLPPRLRGRRNHTRRRPRRSGSRP
jgi:hypothetical protein